jgi:hypothetical protein
VHIVSSFAENLLCIPQLFDRGIATIFHPTKGIIIADVNNMTVKCSSPLGIGRYVDGTFLIDLTLAKYDKALATTGVISDGNEAKGRAKELEILLAVTPVVSLATKLYCGING